MAEMNSNPTNGVDAWEHDIYSIRHWLVFFKTNWRAVIGVSVGAILVGLIVSLLIPKQYTAEATILPPEISDSNMSAMFANVGGLAGDILGSGDGGVKVYPDIAASRTVLDSLLDAPYGVSTFRDELQKRYKFKEQIDENLISKLQDSVLSSTTTTKNNIVTISITYYDPELAAAMANEILNQMELFFKFQYRSAATSQRTMIEQRLSDVEDSLRVSEEKLRGFRESNRTTMLSPNLQLLEGRLMREVEINNTLYIELTRQLEMVKISELQLKPVLNILDRAVPPIRKSKPSRKNIVLLFGAIGFASSVGYLKTCRLMKDYFIRPI